MNLKGPTPEGIGARQWVEPDFERMAFMRRHTVPALRKWTEMVGAMMNMRGERVVRESGVDVISVVSTGTASRKGQAVDVH
jgi:hypothetical protein